MVAGLDLLVTVWRYTYPVDDSQGGALPTGTPVYTRVPARIQAERPTMVLLEQGLEMPAMFTAFLHPGTLVIEENYEIEVTHPVISRWYREHFRVMGVHHSSTYANDTRGVVTLILKRVDLAHGIQ